MNPEDLKKKLEEIIAQSPDQDPNRVAKRQSIMEKMMGSMETLRGELEKVKQQQKEMTQRFKSPKEDLKERSAKESEHFESVKKMTLDQCDLLEDIVRKARVR